MTEECYKENNFSIEKKILGILYLFHFHIKNT